MSNPNPVKPAEFPEKWEKPELDPFSEPEKQVNPDQEPMIFPKEDPQRSYPYEVPLFPSQKLI